MPLLRGPHTFDAIEPMLGYFAVVSAPLAPARPVRILCAALK
jgi:hypothetical protein